MFEIIAGALRQGYFFDLIVTVFVKNDRITVSVPIIIIKNQWSLYHLNKCRMDNQINMSLLSTSLFSYKLLSKVKNIKAIKQ